ncbi:MAG TPA: glycosyltransferase, partial [Planctomycetaceae bacterium]|nr:glycosyltransferase [Planctomycetaceae bacterium]
METALQMLCWVSLVALFYIYAGYPLLVGLLGRLRPGRIARAPITTTVSVVLVVHNEAARIGRKLDSLLAMEGAEQIVEVLVGSDGSTDDSAAITQSYPDPRVKWIPFADRRGKPSVINDLVSQARGEIVLLTDVRQDFAADFLTATLPNFADRTVGVVSGELVLQADDATTTAGEGIGLYWRYEKAIRNAESRFRGVPGATGACYLIRRELFRPIHATTILDDVAIPLQIVSHGFRCLFECGAIAYDRPSTETRQEAIRKRRTIAGAAQLMVQYPQWLLPWRNPLWFEFVSHKLARLTSPVWLVMALVSSAMLWHHPLYAVLCIAQLGCYTAGVIGWTFQSAGRRSSLFGPFLMFLTLNITTAQALWDALRSRYRVTWTKT